MPGRRVRISGRGTTWVREVPGPPGAPVVVLLHGLGATAAMNWPGTLEALGSRFRVVALDQRGHGRGIRGLLPFRLEDCADDAVGLADTLGIERFVAVGYSMGGPVAMLARRRHPTRVCGLVLCATSARFGDDTGEAFPMSAAVAAGLRLTPPVLRRQLSASMLQYAARRYGLPPAMVDEARRHDPAAIVEASRAVWRFDATAWAGDLGGPAASVVTLRDQLVPPRRQLELAALLRAGVFRIDGGHDVCGRDARGFHRVLDLACQAVTAPADRRATG